jgi:hypothetical protein
MMASSDRLRRDSTVKWGVRSSRPSVLILSVARTLGRVM